MHSQGHGRTGSLFSRCHKSIHVIVPRKCPGWERSILGLQDGNKIEEAVDICYLET